MDKLQFLFAVAIGGALGSMARYIMTLFIGDRIEGVFPWGTWVVNMIWTEPMPSIVPVL